MTYHTVNTLMVIRDDIAARFAASKGGNVAGVTEDHRYEMADQIRALDDAIQYILLCI